MKEDKRREGYGREKRKREVRKKKDRKDVKEEIDWRGITEDRNRNMIWYEYNIRYKI